MSTKPGLALSHTNPADDSRSVAPPRYARRHCSLLASAPVMDDDVMVKPLQ